MQKRREGSGAPPTGVVTPAKVLFAIVLIPLLLVLAVVGLPALLWASYLAVRHWFRGADGHPMLPALTTIGFAAAQLVELIGAGPDQREVEPVQATRSGGP